MASDPLERLGSRRMIVLATTIMVAIAFVGSAVSDAPGALLGIALGSPVLLHVERSLVVGAAVAGMLIFLLRGWEGYFPSKLSTSGAEYVGRSAAKDAVQNEDELGEALAAVEGERLALASSLHEDVRALERRVEHLASTSKEVK